MKNRIKKIALACGVSVVLLLAEFTFRPAAVQSAYNDDQSSGSTNIRTGNVKITDVGVYDSNGTARYIPGSPDQFPSGKIDMGATGVVLSTANTSGFSAGHLYFAFLGGSTAALEGSALTVTTPVAGQGVTVQVAAATVGLTNVVGYSSVAASTGSVIGVYSDGWAMALTTGTVVVGDQLATSSLSAGFLFAPTSGTNSLLASTATCGIALQAGNSAGGRVRIKIK
jgi:hypothetical protein